MIFDCLLQKKKIQLNKCIVHSLIKRIEIQYGEQNRGYFGYKS